MPTKKDTKKDARMKLLPKLSPRAVNNGNPLATLNILTYEVGDLNKIMVYAMNGSRTGYLGETKLAVADAITMLRVFCEQTGSDYRELMKLGEERFIERQNELNKGII